MVIPDFVDLLKERHCEWTPINSDGYDDSIQIMVLQDTLNDNHKTGCKTFLLKMPPNTKITTISSHPSFEEVLIISGQLYWMNNDFTNILQTIHSCGYVNRKPHIPHGPFQSHPQFGCLMFVRLYYPSSKL